jgi:hypothetical protein
MEIFDRKRSLRQRLLSGDAFVLRSEVRHGDDQLERVASFSAGGRAIC